MAAATWVLMFERLGGDVEPQPRDADEGGQRHPAAEVEPRPAPVETEEARRGIRAVGRRRFDPAQEVEREGDRHEPEPDAGQLVGQVEVGPVGGHRVVQRRRLLVEGDLLGEPVDDAPARRRSPRSPATGRGRRAPPARARRGAPAGPAWTGVRLDRGRGAPRRPPWCSRGDCMPRRRAQSVGVAAAGRQGLSHGVSGQPSAAASSSYIVAPSRCSRTMSAWPACRAPPRGCGRGPTAPTRRRRPSGTTARRGGPAPGRRGRGPRRARRPRCRRPGRRTRRARRRGSGPWRPSRRRTRRRAPASGRTSVSRPPAPARARSSQVRSMWVRCLTRPAMVMALRDGAAWACSSVRPKAALRMPSCCWRRKTLSASRSVATGGGVPGMVAPSLVAGSTPA